MKFYRKYTESILSKTAIIYLGTPPSIFEWLTQLHRVFRSLRLYLRNDFFNRLELVKRQKKARIVILSKITAPSRRAGSEPVLIQSQIFFKLRSDYILLIDL